MPALKSDYTDETGSKSDSVFRWFLASIAVVVFY
jgi:hypothetical protein